jgi:hexosaminidase
MKLPSTTILVLALISITTWVQAEPLMLPDAGIIPAPAKCELRAGSFAVDAKTQIICRKGAEAETGRFLQAGLKARTGLELKLAKPDKSLAGGIRLELAPAGSEYTEGYALEVSTNGMTICASSAAGLFYGVQSLLQMADAQGAVRAKPLELPAVRITDEPRFAWRGLMLDESRYFFGKQTVEQMLDMMAYLKLNRFHWHLTDQPGWRIEIKKYPKLATIGGQGNASDPNAPAAYYTQADIREIVEYARQRHIVIIPEIDMPGHATAATRAYPEISGGGTGQWAGFTFNPAKEETYVFLENVLKEVAALFPGPYLHLGGDEVHYGNMSWNTDPAIVAFTRSHGMTNAVELEQYFVRRMAGVIHRLGKTTVGWDEIAGAGVNPAQSVVMWWRHDKPEVLELALQNNYRVVLCPRLPCYFDFVQAAGHNQGRLWKGKFNTLADVYHFPEPVTDGLIPAGKESNVLGVEACLWTEQIQDRERLDYMTYPRLAALAEAAWTPASAKDEAGFMERVHVFLHELDRRHIPYFNPFAPTTTPEPPGPQKKAGGTANG